MSLSNNNGSADTIMGLRHKLNMIKAVTENIANTNTIGYKRKMPEALDFSSELTDAIARDKTNGGIKRTNNTFDLAIEGQAEFLIDTENGLEATRNGRFHIDKTGELVTVDGHKVVIVEKNEKFKLSEESDISIKDNGEVFVGAEKFGRIAIRINGDGPVRVHQGYVEGSNVNIMDEVVSLSMLYRSLEASEKTLGMETGVDKELIEKYGRNV